MVLDSSNHCKFNRHVIVRLLHCNEEFMYTNNFDDLHKHILEFKVYIILFSMNTSNYRNMLELIFMIGNI